MRIDIFLRVFLCSITCVVLDIMPSINIDTIFESGSAQITHAYVFDTQRTYSSTGDYAFGDIAFRGGLQATQTTTLRLGITPPLSGPLQLGTGVNNTTFSISSDLILGSVTFSGPNALNKFFFDVAGPYTIFLDSALTLGANQFSFVTTSGAVLDGHNNILTVASGSLFQIITSGSGATVKNLILQGVNQTDFDTTHASNLTFENVQIIAIAGQTAAIKNPNLMFAGQFNIFGYGGTIDIQTPGSSSLSFATQTQLYVSPQTTLILDATHLSTISFTDFSSVLFLDNSFLQVVNGTVALTGGTVIINGIVTLESGTLQLGNGTPADNCALQILPGSKFIIADGATFINNNVN